MKAGAHGQAGGSPDRRYNRGAAMKWGKIYSYLLIHDITRLSVLAGISPNVLVMNTHTRGFFSNAMTHLLDL
jgi:hypothetical protein